MIDAELFARIRRLFFAEHWRVGTIAKELGVHHDTVKHAIEADRFIRHMRHVRSTMLDPYKNFIMETLKKYPRLRSTRLYEMVKARGYPGSCIQLRRFVRTVRPTNSSEAYLRLRTMPGEQAQVDWGHFGRIRVGRATRPLSCFVMVLSFSRAVFARFTLDQRLESFLSCHVSGFEKLGGVPREILYDNLKSVVLERQGELIRFHPQLLELAGHYHFQPKPCAPYRGNEKGKVERQIQYLRHAFFAARGFANIDDLNCQLAEWIERTAHARPVPADADGTIVRDALEREKACLIPLPKNRFGCDLVMPVASGKTPYIRFDLNDYSIPHDWVRKPLILIASETKVRLTDEKGELIARHTRSYDRGKHIEDPKHLERLASEKRRAREIRGRDRLASACPNAKQFLEALCSRGVPLSPQTAHLLRLLDHYNHSEVDAAIKTALERGAVSAAAVAHVLEQKAREKKKKAQVPVVLPDDPRVRELTVIPHALAPYDSLSQTEKE